MHFTEYSKFDTSFSVIIMIVCSSTCALFNCQNVASFLSQCDWVSRLWDYKYIWCDEQVETAMFCTDWIINPCINHVIIQCGGEWKPLMVIWCMKAFVSYLAIISAGDINDGLKCKEREDNKHIGRLSLCSS